MFKTLMDSLSTEQRAKLHEFGMSPQQITNIRSGRALPTEVQVIALADVTGVNRHDLQDEIALLRATPEQLPMLKRVMGKTRGAVAMLLCGVIAGAVGAAAGFSQLGATMYIM